MSICLYDWLIVFLLGWRLLLLLGEDGRAAVVLHLPLELIGARLDGHPGAVEAHRIEALLATQALVTHGEFALNYRNEISYENGIPLDR